MNPQDEQISLIKPYEVRHWSRELNWNEIELYLAVQKVGIGLADLRAYRATTGPSLPLSDSLNSARKLERRHGLYLVSPAR